MDKKDILKKVDHTLLKPQATWPEYEVLIDKAIENNCASVCIPPCYIPFANYRSNGRISICTVIGFPNGYATKEIKCLETKQAILDGASEIDMVINIGFLKDGRYDLVEEEIKEIANICHKRYCRITLKVIIETCLLTEFEIRKMCEIVARSGADYIKTSTGFSTEGATFEVVSIMKEEMDKWNNDELIKKMHPDRDKIRIKAAGGIKDFDDAKKFIELGADRLGTSRLIK